MRQRKSGKPERAVQYLLLADRKFQRLSLRKVRTRSQKRAQPARATPSKEHAPRVNPTFVPTRISIRTIAVAAICVAAGAALIAVAGRSPSDMDVAVGTPLLASASAVRTPAPSPHDAAKPVVSKTSAVAPAPKARASVAPRPKPVPAEVAPTLRPPSPSPAKPLVAVPTTATAAGVERTTAAPAADLMAAASAPGAPLVTITGCVELENDDTFWLKDTSGADAPKSRSWRTGFFKKRTQPIQLVDPANALKLRGYVGHRIAVTGALAKREIRPSSLRRVAAACN